MPIAGIRQPDLLILEKGLRLRRFDGFFDFALPWYQDLETVWLVDGVREPYSMEKLERMYRYLDARGELYFIELAWEDGWIPIGDVTLCPEDMPIVLGDCRFRGRGIGRKVLAALIDRGRQLGWTRLSVGEIFDCNTASRKCFESLGFRAGEKTRAGRRYELNL